MKGFAADINWPVVQNGVALFEDVRGADLVGVHDQPQDGAGVGIGIDKSPVSGVDLDRLKLAAGRDLSGYGEFRVG